MPRAELKVMMHEELVGTNKSAAEAVEKLKSLYPGKRIKAVDTAAGVVIMRSPSRPEFAAFRMWQLDDDKSIAASASEKLMRQVVVLPDADTFGLWLEEFPGISSDPDVGKTLRILLGMTKDTSEKKGGPSAKSSDPTTTSPSIAGGSSSAA
jgi:hypothetical protein